MKTKPAAGITRHAWKMAAVRAAGAAGLAAVIFFVDMILNLRNTRRTIT